MNHSEMQLLFSSEQISAEVRRLGKEISRDHEGRDLLLVGVLKGSFLFFADLARTITAPVTIDFVRLASYGSETRTSGIVEIRKDLELPIEDQDVIIVEDIIDSGCTLETLYHRLLLRKPRSLKVCTLIDKRARREAPIEADYVGLTLEDGFVVGYGLDYDEQYRNLPDIYLMDGTE